MAAGGMENAWWADVLRHGQTSRYASFFDIDWNSADPALRGKVLAPFLGEPYGESLRSGAITLAREDGAPVIRYYDNRFPIRIADHAEIAAAAPDAYDPATEAGRARLHRSAGAAALPARLVAHRGRRDQLATLLRHQRPGRAAHRG